MKNQTVDSISKGYATANDISTRQKVQLNVLMNQLLADAMDLQTQVKQAQWNVKGTNFIGLHKLFDKIAEAVEGYVDLIAERIIQLGGVAERTLRIVAGRTRLEEYPLGFADGSAHVTAISKALSVFRREVRQSIVQAAELGDADAADIFTEISRGVDEWLWFIEAHNQASNTK